MKRLAVAAMAVLALARVGRAEEVAAPDPFNEDLLKYRSFFDYGGFEPDLTGVLPSGYVSRWTVTGGVDATYTDNFDKTRDARGAFWSDAVLGLGWLRRSPRLDGTFDYRFSTPLYQSGAAEGENLTDQTAASSLRWRASERLTLTGSGTVAQNNIGGQQASNKGVRSTYDNRSDQYNALAGASWQPTSAVEAKGEYAYSYLNYVSAEAQGQDTLTQRASGHVAVKASPRDTAKLTYAYDFQRSSDGAAVQETLPDGTVTSLGRPQQRQSHNVDAAWDHALLRSSGRALGVVTLSYRFEEDFADLQPDYWTQAVNLGYGQDLSVRTHVSARAGYEWGHATDATADQSWIVGAEALHRFSERTSVSGGVERALQFVPEEGQFIDTWNWHAVLDHLFSEYTKGSLKASQSWEYRPVSSRTDFAAMTRTKRADASLTSKLWARTKAALSVSWELGQRDVQVEGTGNQEAAQAGDYWESGAAATLDSGVAREGFWGARLEVNRRQEAGTDEDYVLGIASLLYQREFLTWLTGGLRYSFERRNYDAVSSLDSYYENRVYGSLTATW